MYVYRLKLRQLLKCKHFVRKIDNMPQQFPGVKFMVCLNCQFSLITLIDSDIIMHLKYSFSHNTFLPLTETFVVFDGARINTMYISLFPLTVYKRTVRSSSLYRHL